MSYCRFSSDNWMCDVYVYESERGYEVHVSNNRYITPIPKLPKYNESPEKWFEAYQEQMKVLDNAKTEKIGGIFDGKDFCLDSLTSLREKLKEIKNAGYNVPDFVFTSIEEEIKESA